MDYMTAKEASGKWNVSDRQVSRLLSEGRIPGAKKFGVSWMIPADADKPLDPRKLRKLPREEPAAYLFLTAADLPKNAPDAVLSGLAEPLCALVAADIAFRRGDPEPAKTAWRETPPEDKTKLSAASLATAAAISSGDYALYDEVESFLRGQIASANSVRDKALLSLPGTLAAVSMAAPGMTPDWLKRCDFALFPHTLRPFLLYLYALHLRNIGAYAEMLGVAKAALLLMEKHATFTWLDVYFYVVCAAAANALYDAEQAKRYLDAALALGMPSGFIAPFADNLGDLGGLMETVMERDYPQYRMDVIDLWGCSFKNYMRFHNAFAKGHVTTVLSAQEYQVARLIAHGETYAATARRMNLSASRIKHILTDVYAKLFIHGKQELNSFIL